MSTNDRYRFGPVGMPLLTLTTGGVLALRARKATPLAFATAAGGGSLAMTVLGKRLLHRKRPPRRDAAQAGIFPPRTTCSRRH